MSTCLHLVCGPGLEALQSCARQCADSDSILFLDAGVLQLFRSELAGLSRRGIALFFLSPDLAAHGLQQAAENLAFGIVPDSEFGRLLGEHDHCLSWK